MEKTVKEMRTLALVSIIVPVHNAEEYLIDCLNSILNQTYKNIEVICVNDHSIDHSYDILKDFKKKDDRIKVLSLGDSEFGAGAARNRGLEAETGDYVAFCDSDDMMTESMIELMLDKIIKEKSDIIYCANKSLYEDGSSKIRQFKKFSPQKINSSKAEELYVNMFDLPLEPWNKLICYKKFKSIRFDETILSGQDVPYNLELLLNAEKLSFINMPLYIYRVRSTSLCHNEKNILSSFFLKHSCLINILKKYHIYKNYEIVYMRYLVSDTIYNLKKLTDRNKRIFIQIMKRFIIDNNLTIKQSNKCKLYSTWLGYHLFPVGRSYIRFRLKERFKYQYNKMILLDYLNAY